MAQEEPVSIGTILVILVRVQFPLFSRPDTIVSEVNTDAEAVCNIPECGSRLILPSRQTRHLRLIT